jgi:hypothetical protein
MCRQAAGDICVINANTLVLPVASYLVSNRDKIAEL